MTILHLTDNPMGRNPYTFVHTLRALHRRSGVPIRQVLRKLQSSSDFQVKGARIIIIMMMIIIIISLSTFGTTFLGNTELTCADTHRALETKIAIHCQLPCQ